MTITTGDRDARRLVIAPHADDEALGCGGLLAKYPNQSAVVVLSRPTAVRSMEFHTAKEILDYQESFALGLRDGYVGDDMTLLVYELDKILNDWQPDELYLPFPSMHQDHIAAYEGGMRSARLSMTSAHWFPPTIMVYDVAAYDMVLYQTDLRWNFFEKLTEGQIDAKVRAVEAYDSESVIGPHPANGIKAAAATQGASHRTHWCERYALVRGVR